MSSHKRRMSMHEMLKFQGMKPHIFDDAIAQSADLSATEKTVRTAIGNSMSCNVLERWFPRIAWATGAVSEKPDDHWADPAFVKRGARF